MLNKIKYGVIITFALQVLKMVGLEVAPEIEPALNGLIGNILILIPWVASFFIKETEATTDGLTLK